RRARDAREGATAACSRRFGAAPAPARWHGGEAALAERLATADAPRAEERAFEDAVRLEGLEHELRARRREAALRPEERRDEPLIGADQRAQARHDQPSHGRASAPSLRAS